MAADPDQDFINFVNSQRSPSPGGSSTASPTATMTPDPDQDFIDMVNKSRSPTPTATSSPAPSGSPYTDQAVKQSSSALYKASQIGTGTGWFSSLVGSAARGVGPARAFLAGARLGGIGGAAAGALVPIAGETGISELAGGVIGGLIVGSAAAWAASKAQSTVADVVAPQSIFGSKAEQAQTQAHPYVSMIGGGLAFGKPNPMNVVRAGKTLASPGGMTALATFAKTGGRGMTPQAIDEMGNVVNVAMAGGLNSAMNVKDQIEAGRFDPQALAVAAASGLIFNEPWFHQANPAAAAAAKVMKQNGLPTGGPSTPPGVAPLGMPAPPAPVTPGVVPPPTPRVPGLLDFEVAGPRTETARAPEAPLPEAPIPAPGTEGVITNATQERPVTKSSVPEHTGIPPGEDLSANAPEVRPGDREQAGNRGGVEPAAQEPVAGTREQRIAEAQQRLDELQFESDQQGSAFPQEKKQHMAALQDFIDSQPEATKAPETPFSIKEDNGVFKVVDSRKPDALTIPFSTEEAAQKRKTVLDNAFLKQVAQGATEKGAEETAKEMLRLQREHEQSLVEEAQGHQARGGDELLDAVAEHGVPINDPKYSGELQNLKESFAPKNKYGQEQHRPLATGSGEKLYFGNVFKANAGSMDSLTQFLKGKGFNVETPDDTINLLDERLRSGNKVYGDEAGAQAREDQSFQDYQGPLYAKSGKGILGGLFGSKDATKEPIAAPGGVEPIKDPQTLHNVLEADKDKGVEVVESTGGENEPGEETLEMGMNRKQIARRLNQDSYKGSIVHTAAKEGLQNNVDAVRAAGATDENPGKIIINIDYDARTVELDDRGYGTGMSPKTIREALFTIGGTEKGASPENTSGGIGVAKIGMFYGAKRVVVDSVKDGLKSHIDATGEQIQDGTFKNIKTRSDEPNGTRLFIEIPKTYIDGYGETKHVYFEHDPAFLQNPLFGPYEVVYNGKTLPVGIHTTGWQKDNVFNFKWGHVDVYVDPRPVEDPNYKVMSAGLHQFDVSRYSIFGTGEPIKHNMVFDVRSHVKADHPDYPFNNQREGFQGRRDVDVQDMWNYLKKQSVEQQLLAAKEDFSKLQVLPEIDVEKNLTPEDQKAISNAFAEPVRPKLTGKPEQTKSVTFTPDSVITTGKGGKQTTQKRADYGIEDRTFQPQRNVDFEKTKLDVSNLDPNKPYYHNNTNKTYDDIPGAHELIAQVGNTLVKFMRHVGEKFDLLENYGELRKTDPTGWFGGIAFDTTYGAINMVNPFKGIWFNPGDLSIAAVHSPDAAAAETMHTFLHEITHMPQRNEGAGFTWEMKTNYGRLKAYKVEYQKYEKILENIYTKHWDAIRLIRERHKSYDTSNRAASFESGNKAGPESGKGAAAGEGASPEYASENVGVPEQGRTGDRRAGETDRKPGSLGDILSGQEPRQVAGAEPAHPEVAAPAPELPGGSAAAPVHQGVSGRSGVEGIKDTLSGIREAAAQPPETPEQRKFAPHPVETGDVQPRPPTPNEAAGPGLRDMSEQQMSQVIDNSLQQFHDAAITTGLDTSGGLSHNDIIDAGRMAIRHGVDPEAVAKSRAIPEDQKYTVVRAHAEDLRDVSAEAEDVARSNPSKMNKEAAEAAFADFSNWDKETVQPLRKAVDEKYPGMPPEEYNPRSMTDLRQQMIRQNDRDFTASEKRTAEQNMKAIERAVTERNKELMKYDAELKAASPDLAADIKNGDDLFKYVAEVIDKIPPCA